jgi:hypothetical protein
MGHPAPRPARCAGCGARLVDGLGDLVIFRIQVRAGRERRVVAREAEVTCVCGRVWRSAGSTANGA